MKEYEKDYHHGNLRKELIEKGIKMINDTGEEKLSLRKLAVECGVSNAAPYTHFKNKDELLKAMSEYILEILTSELEKICSKYKDNIELLAMLGKCYVMFFYENPEYYHFIFSRKDMEVDLSLKMPKRDLNMPMNILKREAIREFTKMEMPEEVIQDKIIAMWALVQGLTSIVIMPNVNYAQQWDEKIEEIIKSSFITCY